MSYKITSTETKENISSKEEILSLLEGVKNNKILHFLTTKNSIIILTEEINKKVLSVTIPFNNEVIDSFKSKFKNEPSFNDYTTDKNNVCFVTTNLYDFFKELDY